MSRQEQKFWLKEARKNRGKFYREYAQSVREARFGRARSAFGAANSAMVTVIDWNHQFDRVGLFSLESNGQTYFVLINLSSGAKGTSNYLRVLDYEEAKGLAWMWGGIDLSGVEDVGLNSW